MSERKPCPFCGAKYSYISPPEETDSKMWTVFCDGNVGDTLPGGGGYCGAQVVGETEEEAVNGWNRRAPIVKEGVE